MERSFFLLLLGFPLAANAQTLAWERIALLPATEFTALHAAGDTLFAASVNKIYYSTDGGSQWHGSAVVAPQVDFIIAMHFSQGRLYVGTGFDGVYSSTNLGQSWQAENAGLTGLGAQNISGFAARGDSLYVSTYGAKVFVKRISANSLWSPYSQGMFWGNVESVTNLNDTLFAGAGGSATYALQAYPGHTWTERPLGVFDGTFNSLLAITRQGSTLLAAGNIGLYRREDNGSSWTYVNTGTGILGSARFVTMGNRVVANLAKPANLSFLQYTDNEGMTWHNFQPALGGSFGFDIAYWNGHLYAARSTGLWRIALTTPVDEPVNAPAALEQNYPNPFTNHTTIPVEIGYAAAVNITIFDASGRAVQTLHRGALLPGKHFFEWEASALPSGVYYCRLSGPEHAETRRLLLMR